MSEAPCPCATHCCTCEEMPFLPLPPCPSMAMQTVGQTVGDAEAQTAFIDLLPLLLHFITKKLRGTLHPIPFFPIISFGQNSFFFSSLPFFIKKLCSTCDFIPFFPIRILSTSGSMVTVLVFPSHFFQLKMLIFGAIIFPSHFSQLKICLLVRPTSFFLKNKKNNFLRARSARQV